MTLFMTLYATTITDQKAKEANRPPSPSAENQSLKRECTFPSENLPSFPSRPRGCRLWFLISDFCMVKIFFKQLQTIFKPFHGMKGLFIRFQGFSLYFNLPFKFHRSWTSFKQIWHTFNFHQNQHEMNDFQFDSFSFQWD